MSSPEHLVNLHMFSHLLLPLRYSQDLILEVELVSCQIDLAVPARVNRVHDSVFVNCTIVVKRMDEDYLHYLVLKEVCYIPGQLWRTNLLIFSYFYNSAIKILK